MGIPRQEYWSRLAVLSLGDLLDLGIESGSFPSLHGQVVSSALVLPGKPYESRTECLQREQMAHHILTAFQNSAVI